MLEDLASGFSEAMTCMCLFISLGLLCKFREMTSVVIDSLGDYKTTWEEYTKTLQVEEGTTNTNIVHVNWEGSSASLSLES